MFNSDPDQQTIGKVIKSFFLFFYYSYYLRSHFQLNTFFLNDNRHILCVFSGVGRRTTAVIRGGAQTSTAGSCTIAARVSLTATTPTTSCRSSTASCRSSEHKSQPADWSDGRMVEKEGGADVTPPACY